MYKLWNKILKMPKRHINLLIKINWRGQRGKNRVRKKGSNAFAFFSYLYKPHLKLNYSLCLT